MLKFDMHSTEKYKCMLWDLCLDCAMENQELNQELVINQ